MKPKLFIYLPFLFLVGAVLIHYFKLPLEWFLVSTGLLVLYTVFGREDKKHEAEAPKQSFDTRNLIEGVGDPAFIYDASFKILAFNNQAEKLFGIKKDEVINKIVEPKDATKPSWQRFTQILFPSLAPTMFIKSKEGEFPQIIDVAFTSPDLHVRTTTSRVIGGDNQFLGFLKIVEDKTQEIRAIKEKSEFITVASHQLRTPVTSVIWAADALASSPLLPPDLKEIALATQDNAKKLGNLVEDLLNISKMEEGRFGYNFAQMDVVEFINKILSAILPQARRLGIKIFFDKPPAALQPIYADEVKLGMAFGNLLDNAIRYNVKDGEVAVRVREVPGQPLVEISVRDTGIGIPAEEVQKLFNKFFRATNAVKFETQGSGLGLYITQSIIQAHGGNLKVESELNKGSVFSFTLPTDRTLIPPTETPVI